MFRFVYLTALLLTCSFNTFDQQVQAEEPPVIGIMADVQYADKDTGGARHYRTTLKKLEECVADLSERDLAFVIQLGDIVDGHGKDVKKSIDDLDRVLSVFNKLPMPKYHVVGNHCLSVDKPTLGAKLGLKRFYYDFTVPSAKGWRFVVLDGNDAGYGVIGDEQLDWFHSTLDKSGQEEEKVICFCHFALLKEAAKHHRMAKPGPILKAMDEANCVVAWFAGHDHAGGYAERNGVHHVTVKGMVEAPVENAYAVIELHEDRLEETGFGKEPSRELAFSVPSDDSVHWWAEQTMQFAKSLEKADSHDSVVITLGESFALSGDIERFWDICGEVKDQERIREYVPFIAYHLITAGRVDEAHQIVAKLDSDAERDEAHSLMASAFAGRHNFELAAQMLSKVGNPSRRNWALEKIAKAQAESGRWDDAVASLDKINVAEDMDADAKEYLKKVKAKILAVILRCRADKVARPPERPTTDAASRYRAALNLWGLNATVYNIERARAQADKLTDPERLAAAWRGIAWYYAQNHANDDALEALTQGVAAAQAITEPHTKSLNLVLLADLYLELGERELAVALLPKAQASEKNMMKLMRGLTSFTTGPVIIGVLVRSGHTDRALEMLRSAKSDPSTGWIAFGEFCADTGQLDLAASLLEEQDIAASRAWLAVGVASTLIRDRGKAAELRVSSDGT